MHAPRTGDLARMGDDDRWIRNERWQVEHAVAGITTSGHGHAVQPKHMPSLNAANLILALTCLFFLLASYAVLFSAFLPLSAIPVCPRTTVRGLAFT